MHTKFKMLCLYMTLLLSSSFFKMETQGAPATKKEVPLDLLFTNVKVIDGTGSPWFLGEVGITNGTISYVQPYTPSTDECSATKQDNVKKVVTANGNYLTPGFLDSHTHDDVGILQNEPAIAKILQGVTTVITGNCGFSTFPGGSLNRVRENLESLLGEVSPNDMYDNFSGMQRNFTTRRHLPNVISLVGHSSLRLTVMEFANREATESEINQMCEILEEQFRQGASGISLGLMYTPSNYASTTELIELAKVAAKYGRVVTAHIRSYDRGLIDGVEEFVNILRQSGARGLLSHLQIAGKPYWGTMMVRALEILEKAREDENIDVAVDMYPYLAGSSTILQILPPSSMQQGFEEFLKNVQNASYVDSLRYLTEEGEEEGWESKVKLIGWENITIGSTETEMWKKYEGKNITHAAREEGMNNFDLFLQLVIDDEGRTNVIMFQQSQDDQNLVFKSRLQMVGSDSIVRAGGKPHPRGYGTFPRVLKNYVREGKIISLEEGVRKMTSMTAQRFGIMNRGLIRIGMAADLIMFDDTFEDRSSYEDPAVHPSKLLGVWVNGEMVVDENGEIVGRENPPKPGTVIISG